MSLARSPWNSPRRAGLALLAGLLVAATAGLAGGAAALPVDTGAVEPGALQGSVAVRLEVGGTSLDTRDVAVPEVHGLVAEGVPLERSTLTDPLLGETGQGIGAGPLERPLEEPPLVHPGVRVAAGGGALALWGILAGRLPLAFLAPLYSRLDRADLLRHPARQQILRIVREEPGINVTCLHQRMDLGWGSLLYHLRRLEDESLLASRRWGRSRRYFPNDRAALARASGFRALRPGNGRQLALLVRAQPGCSQEELANMLALNKSVVSKYARRLEEAQLVERRIGRNRLELYPTTQLEDLLEAEEARHSLAAREQDQPPAPAPQPPRATAAPRVHPTSAAPRGIGAIPLPHARADA